MRNEANREGWEAKANRKCETKPIRCEAVRGWADMVGADMRRNKANREACRAKAIQMRNKANPPGWGQGKNA